MRTQDISAPIKIGDTWHVFMDCVPEGCPALARRRSSPIATRACNTKGYSSTYLVMGFANVRAGTQKCRGKSSLQPRQEERRPASAPPTTATS